MSKCPYCKKEIPNRSEQQNKALWTFLTLLADSLNEAGLDVRTTLKPDFNIPWNKNRCHDLIWVPIQQLLFRTKSTRELSKLEQIDKIHELIMRELGEKHGLEYIPFPTQEKIDGKIIGRNYTL